MTVRLPFFNYDIQIFLRNVPGNRYFRKNSKKLYPLSIVFDFRIADDVAKYIQDNNVMPRVAVNASQGEEFGRMIVQNNLRFLFGFYCTENDFEEIDNQID